MPKLYIDADGCPVIKQALAVAKAYSMDVVIVCDTSHDIYYEGVTTILADKGRDSSDFVLLQKIKKHDIVVTQDYGLATLCLSKQAYPISQDGMRYTADNIDALLYQRMMHAKRRKHGMHTHIKKRTEMQNEAFTKALEVCVMEVISNGK